MTTGEILGAQLLDPFRLVLLAGLVLTMLRTEATTGRWLPLAAGAVFVALIIPMTMGVPEGAAFARVALLGLVVNAAILAVILALHEGWQRARR